MSERHRMLPHGEFFMHLSFPSLCHSIKIILFREDQRRNEIDELVSHGKIPHEQELEQHPEKSMEGRMCEYSFFIPTISNDN